MHNDINLQGKEINDIFNIRYSEKGNTLFDSMPVEHAKQLFTNLLMSTIALQIRYLLTAKEIKLGNLTFDPDQITENDIDNLTRGATLKYISEVAKNKRHFDLTYDEILLASLIMFDDEKLKAVFHRTDLPQQPTRYDFATHDEWMENHIKWVTALTELPKQNDNVSVVNNDSDDTVQQFVYDFLDHDTRY